MDIPKKLETSRLIIRPFNENDRSAFIEFMTNDRSTRFLSFTAEQKTNSGANNLLDFVISSYGGDNPIFSLAIEDKNSGDYLGSIGIAPYGGFMEFECYYTILQQHTKKGFAKEAMIELLRYCQNRGAKKIFAFTHPENIPSEKLAYALGMKFMGNCKKADLPFLANYFEKSL